MMKTYKVNFTLRLRGSIFRGFLLSHGAVSGT